MDTKTKYQCTLGCQRYFGNLAGLNMHMAQAQKASACPAWRARGTKPLKEKWPCRYCGNSYTEKVLANHIREGGCVVAPKQPTEAELTCTECGRVFSDKGAFSAHINGIRVHMTEKEAKADQARAQKAAYAQNSAAILKVRNDRLAAMGAEDLAALRKTRQAGKRRRLAEKRDWIADYKSQHGCTDCGVKGLIGECYDLDHLPQYDKVDSVSSMLGVGWERLIEEIEKCEVVCANCHRIRTNERRILAARG